MHIVCFYSSHMFFHMKTIHRFINDRLKIKLSIGIALYTGDWCLCVLLGRGLTFSDAYRFNVLCEKCINDGAVLFLFKKDMQIM